MVRERSIRFSENDLSFGHIGDSRIYYLPRDGPMQQITEDHTFVGYQMRSGRITERVARTDPRRNRLQKVLGADQQFIVPQVGMGIMAPGDTFLLCSDGIVDGIWNNALEEAVRQGMTAPDLVRKAIDEGSKDNVTALIIRVVE